MNVFGQNLENHYQQLEADFLGYIRDTEQQFYFSVTEPPDSGIFLAGKFDYCHRWSESYRNRFVLRVSRLQDWYLLNSYPVTFLTLTTYQEKDEMIEEQLTKLRYNWSKLLQVLRKMKPGLDYFTNMDFHRSGYAHLHIILFCTVTRDEMRKIRKLWNMKYKAGGSKYGVDFRVRMRDNINYLISYILKHTGKVLYSSEDVPGYLRFHSVIWAMSRKEYRVQGVYDYPAVRLFSVSRRLASVMKLPSEDKSTVSVFHVNVEEELNELYSDHDVSPYDFNASHVYRWEKKRNVQKVKRAVDFFCDLDF